MTIPFCIFGDVFTQLRCVPGATTSKSRAHERFSSTSGKTAVAAFVQGVREQNLRLFVD